MCEIEVFLMVDEDGNYVVHKDRDELQATYDNDVGEANKAARIIAITLNVPTPEPVEVTIDVPAEPSKSSVKVS